MGDFLMEKKIIGYDDCLRYLHSPDSDKETLIETIAQKTRNYAKRQETFWRGLKKKIIAHETLKNTLPQVLGSGLDIIRP